MSRDTKHALIGTAISLSLIALYVVYAVLTYPNCPYGSEYKWAGVKWLCTVEAR